MVSPYVPLRLTCDADGEDWEPGDSSTGQVLNRRTTDWLQASLDGWTLEQRKLQLQDLDWRLFIAYDMATRNKSRAAIADRITALALRRGDAPPCSVRTAIRLVKVATEFVKRDDQAAAAAKPANPEERFHALEALSPHAATVHLLRGHGWPVQQIRDNVLPSLTVEQVVELASFARRYMGPEDRSLMRHQSRRRIRVA